MISQENLVRAIRETNKGHRWRPGHRPNKTVRYMEAHMDEAAEELRDMILRGFQPTPLRARERWDKSAQKYRTIAEPALWPDQYIHHALVQVLQPVIMRGMDYWCCGSVKGRGISRGKRGIERWIREDPKGTRWCESDDIRKFYDTLDPEVVFGLLKRKVKDRRLLDFAWIIIRDGFVAGTYYAQWFANFALQGLDRLIRANPATRHYVRYMDNMTIFGRSKRGLHRLREAVSNWLTAHRLSLKGDWQIYPTDRRQPSAMGYRYSRKGTRLRKRNLLRLSRDLRDARRRWAQHRWVSPKRAAGLLSRLGQMRHCHNFRFYRACVPVGMQRRLKNIIRKEQMKWNTSLALTP